jgi:hypothetical protein
MRHGAIEISDPPSLPFSLPRSASAALFPGCVFDHPKSACARPRDGAGVRFLQTANSSVLPLVRTVTRISAFDILDGAQMLGGERGRISAR